MRYFITTCLFLSAITISFAADWKVGDDYDPANPPANLWSYSEDYPNYYAQGSGGEPNSYITSGDGVRLYHDHCMLRTGKPLAHSHIEKDYGDEGMTTIKEANDTWWHIINDPPYVNNKYEITRNTLVQISDATFQRDCHGHSIQKVFTTYDYEPADIYEVLDFEIYEVNLTKEQLKVNDIIIYYTLYSSIDHSAVIIELDPNTKLPSKYSFKYADSPVYECSADPNHPFYSPFVCTYEDDFKIFRKKPDCWLYSRQCRGDADGLVEGNWQTGIYHVGDYDMAILQDAWQIKEPTKGPGLTDSQMCADFDHQLQGNSSLGYYRVGSNDLSILLTYWKINEPTWGPGIPSCSD